MYWIYFQIPEDECGCDDRLIRQKKPRNWVALLHYPSEKSGQTTMINDTQCAGVIDRVCYNIVLHQLVANTMFIHKEVMPLYLKK